MSSPEQNKKVVLALFDAFNRNDMAAIADFCTEDMYWRQPNMEKVQSPSLNGIVLTAQAWPRDIAMQIMGQAIKNCRDEKFVVTIKTLIAEGDYVACEAESYAINASNGREYMQHYHHLFQFRDNKIVDWREYQDTAHCADVWIAPN